MPRLRPVLPDLDDLAVGLRLLRDLPRFLRTPLTVEQSAAAVRARLRDRGGLLVARIAAAVAIPGSPYRRLLEHAGIELAEVAALIEREGVEGALGALLRAGVYLSGDELKGRRPVVRGSLELTVDPASLLNPRAVVHGRSESSGSRGPRTAVPIDLAAIADHAVDTQVTLQAHGGGAWRHAHYGAPGGTAVTNPLELAKGGRAPDRWFTPVALDAPGLAPRYRLGDRALRAVARVAGVRLPPPTLAPLDDPLPVARWMSEVLARGEVPHVWTLSSSALRVCQAALDAGVEIAGGRFTAGGEPTTAARRAAMESAGVVVLPRMGTTETDILSYACVHPDHADDMHFFEDRHVLIQPEREAATAGLPPRAMLLSTLLPSAPLFFLNVCMGDQAIVERRRCGCPLEDLGLDLHLHEVRSFEKLTAGGVALLDRDLLRILDEVLPARFGGRPTDYQLVETPDGERARPVVMLAVDPRVGPLDTAAVAEAFLTGIGEGSGGERISMLQWRSAGVLRVVRERPRRTASGKVLHLHLDTGTAPARHVV